MVLALGVGIYLGGHPSTLPGPVRDSFVEEDRALRAEIVDTIEDNFYKEVDESKLDDAALKGIVDSLDDSYSHYLTPKEAKDFQETVSGQFEGVGMSVEKDTRGLRVLNVFEGSPAADAGMSSGWRARIRTSLICRPRLRAGAPSPRDRRGPRRDRGR